jgi:uncharacterized protein YbaR (Trm112 family)
MKPKPKMSDPTREAFERHFSKPPYNFAVDRYPATSAWPKIRRQYRDYSLELAWLAWQEATRLERERRKEMTATLICKTCSQAFPLDLNEAPLEYADVLRKTVVEPGNEE